MNQNERLVLTCFLLAVLLICSVGCKRSVPSSVIDNSLTFFNGLWKGVTLSKGADSLLTPPGYDWGFWIGRIWFLACFFVGGAVCEANTDSSLLSIIASWASGFAGGCLLYGILYGMIWLIESIFYFGHWLWNILF